MKQLTLLICILSTLAGAQEWTSLFNGENLHGWMMKTAPADAGRAWFRVVDSTIEAYSLTRSEHDYVWLLSDKEYSNFKLKLKFQAFRTSLGNSGIQIRSQYDDNISWLNGPQIDINPPGFWRTGMMWDETHNHQQWLWPEIPQGEWVDESMANPEMKFYFASDEPQWNDMEICANGTLVTIILNGVQLVQWDGAGVLDDENHQNYGVGMQGHIALQIHKNDALRIRFRDIFIQELP